MPKRINKVNNDQTSTSIRLNKYLSESGICSRRQADLLIEQGKVTIDGTTAAVGSKVTKNQLVKVNGKTVKQAEKLVLIAFNKPRGIVCTAESREPNNIIDYIKYPSRIYPVGRLDKDSEGIILLTNDGELANQILKARNHHEKEYIVKVNKSFSDDFIIKMASGVPILDTVTRKCKVKRIGKDSFSIILTQGLNRQIRRMCEYFGYKVVSLKRIRILNIHLGKLKTGQYRNITRKELETLKSLTGQ